MVDVFESSIGSTAAFQRLIGHLLKKKVTLLTIYRYRRSKATVVYPTPIDIDVVY